MKIKLADWASIAEILGAVAIVISLFFVGLQLSDGNRETRAATTQAALDSEMFFQAELARYADVWQEVVIGGDISDPVATRRAIALFSMMMTLNDNKFQMMKSGFLDYSAINMGWAVSQPFFETWKKSAGAASRSKGFMELIENARVQDAPE